MTFHIVLDKDHTLNVGPGAVLAFVASCIIFFFLGVFDIQFAWCVVLDVIATSIVLYNMDINGKSLLDIFFKRAPTKA